MTTSKPLGALLLVAGLTTACWGPPPRGVVFVRVRPPRDIVEMHVSSPGPGYVWISGFHRWDGGTYVWVPGRWERPAAGYRRWVPGRWRSHHGQWYWVEGHWR